MQGRREHELDVVSALKELRGTPCSNPHSVPSLSTSPPYLAPQFSKKFHACPKLGSLSGEITLPDQAHDSGGRETWSAT